MPFIEFTLRLQQAELVRQKLSRIQDVFCVQVEFTSPAETAARTGQEWLKVIGTSYAVCEEAKEYIMSLADPETVNKLAIPSWFHKELVRDNHFLGKLLERQSRAVVSPLSATELSIKGSCLSVNRATQVISCKVQELEKEFSGWTANGSNSRGAESELVDSNTKAYLQKIGYQEDNISCAAVELLTSGQPINANTLLQKLVMQLNSSLSPEASSQDIGSSLSRTVKTYGEVNTNGALTTASSTSDADHSSLTEDELREIVIDGSNVALHHGGKEVFSCRGIAIVVKWFQDRGHKRIVVFVPQWRQEGSKPESPITDQDILRDLEKDKILVFTPSRRLMDGRRVTPYDDRYILKYAASRDSIIVSNDTYRDLQKETPEWKSLIEKRLLMYSFVGDMFMPPDDPLGRHGPKLDDFLKKGSILGRICPYLNKCTYGAKCRFYHPGKDSGDGTSGETSSVPSNTKLSSAMQKLQIDDSMTKRSGSPAQPFRSCAVEHKLAESSLYTVHDNDIIARGPRPRDDRPLTRTQADSVTPHNYQQPTGNPRPPVAATMNSYELATRGMSDKQQFATGPVSSHTVRPLYYQPNAPSWNGYYPPQSSANSSIPAHVMHPYGNANYMFSPGYPPHAAGTLRQSPMFEHSPTVYHPPSSQSFVGHSHMLPVHANHQAQYVMGAVPPNASQRVHSSPVIAVETQPIRSVTLMPYPHLLRSAAAPSDSSIYQQQSAHESSIYQQLSEVFPKDLVEETLAENPQERDVEKLATLLLQKSESSH